MDALLTALGLVMLIEGLLPFAAPARWREAISAIGRLNDGQIRFFGLALISAGLLLLLVVQ